MLASKSPGSTAAVTSQGLPALLCCPALLSSPMKWGQSQRRLQALVYADVVSSDSMGAWKEGWKLARREHEGPGCQHGDGVLAENSCPACTPSHNRVQPFCVHMCTLHPDRSLQPWHEATGDQTEGAVEQVEWALISTQPSRSVFMQK